MIMMISDSVGVMVVITKFVQRCGGGGDHG